MGLFFFLSTGLVLAEDTLSEAKKLAEDSNQILSELEGASQSGDTAKTQALATVYSQTRDKLEQEAATLKAQGQNEEASSIEERVQEAASKHEEVLKRVRGQVPEQAHFGIDRALQASSRSQGNQAGGIKGGPNFEEDTEGNARGFGSTSEKENGIFGGGPPSFAQGGPRGRGGHGRRGF